MKPFIQKLITGSNSSFYVRTHRTPDFEVGWHQHVELELILFTEGEGIGFVGNSVSDFKTGDIYFLGSNLPHTFQKRDSALITSAVVIQFKSDFWGNTFMQLPECKAIADLFEHSLKGIKLTGYTRSLLKNLVIKMEKATGFSRVILLSQCLELIAHSKDIQYLSTYEIKLLNARDKERIDKVFQYTASSFKEDITLSKIAAVACMSVPAFCNYFKKSTKKTYIDFLNEIRIDYACKQLMETDKTVLEICFECGFNTLPNFHKVFLKNMKVTPLQFRKKFKSSIVEYITA